MHLSDMIMDASPRRFEAPAALALSPDAPTTPVIVSAGPSTPTTLRALPMDQLKLLDLTPPTRPKSTPFPHQEEVDIPSWREDSNPRHSIVSLSSEVAHKAEHPPSSRLTLQSLPVEIHEAILDHLFGMRASTTTRSPAAGSSACLRGWNSALRHSRRKQRTDLALVSKTWRVLVQERLYRHLKIKGTKESIYSSIAWFVAHTHLMEYVRHIEIWVPVWERRPGVATDQVLIAPTTPDRTALIRVINANGIAGFEQSNNLSSAYQQSSGNASLEEILTFVNTCFPEACVLTLEGGHSKKPPQIDHFMPSTPADAKLPSVSSIKTLVIKGAYRFIQCESDLLRIVEALPNLQEAHYNYAKAKSKAYATVAMALRDLPPTISHLNISIESTYCREALSPSLWRKVYQDQGIHICSKLALALPRLEHLQYTGRICHHFFDIASWAATQRDTRGNYTLKSLDIIVKNTCRPSNVWQDGSGISDWAFIQTFERLIASGVRALEVFKALKFLRIRFIDLDSQFPLLNPFFQLKDNVCTGLWSDDIVSTLARVRPAARFPELSEDLGLLLDGTGKVADPQPTMARMRPTSMKFSSYEMIADPMTIN